MNISSMSRLPPATLLLCLASLAASHALPRPTTSPQELNVQPYPMILAPTEAAMPAPTAAAQLFARDYNTVCGYIGGDPALPATCSAGSHCAVAVDHGAIGCCPDGGACTTGVFTGCVDGSGSGSGSDDPYVYTCSGGQVCYKNVFEGGYYQYGCGTASNMGTTVAASASGKTRVVLTSVSVRITGTASEATATKKHRTKTSGTATETASSNSETASSSGTASSGTASSTDTASTSGTASSSNSASTTGTATTNTASKAESTTGASATSTSDAAAPAAGNGKKNTGAIIGGTISGVAALVAVIAFALWFWRRKKGNQRQGPGIQKPEYIGPVSQTTHSFSPVPNMDEAITPLPRVPPPPRLVTQEDEYDHSPPRPPRSPEPYSSTYGGYGYGPVGGSGMPLDNDEVPLTRATPEPHDFSYSSSGGLGPIAEERPASGGSGAGYVRSGTGGGPFYQQNRGPTGGRNLTWL